MQQLAALLCVKKLMIGDFAQRKKRYFQYLKIQGCCLRRCAVSKDHVFIGRIFCPFTSSL